MRKLIHFFQVISLIFIFIHLIISVNFTFNLDSVPLKVKVWSTIFIRFLKYLNGTTKAHCSHVEEI